MSQLSDAIAKGFAKKYDDDAQAVTKIMEAEAAKTLEEVKAAKLATGQAIRVELAEARAAQPADQDYIRFLVSLLNS